MAEKDPLVMVASVVTRVEARITTVATTITDPGLRSTLLRYTDPIFTAWRDVQAAVETLRTSVPVIAGDTRFSENERQIQAGRVITDASSTINTALTRMQTEATGLDRALAPLGDVARPTPVDGAQEARLAGVKSDIVMVLDKITTDPEVFTRLVKFLNDANAAGDQLTAWLIASSGWVPLYLEARGANVAMWEQTLGEALDKLIQGEAAIARRILAELRGSDGLDVAIKAAQYWVKMSFGALGIKAAA